MAVGKEIRTQIASIKNTQKITSAMQMVAASKMRKAQERMTSARPYAEKIRSVISHIAAAHTEYQHSYLVEREVKRVGIIVISSDRGLCGGLNINLFKPVLAKLTELEEQKIEVRMSTIGSKASSFFKRIMGKRIIAESTQLGDAPSITDLIGSVKVILDAYENGEIDEILLAYNDFVNTMTQSPTIEQLVPIKKGEEKELQHYWDYLYEPESKSVLDGLMTRYVESLVYQGVVENNASEQAARMVAMKSATDNAGEFIDELQLIYNKARQAAITQEISEIVGGAAAL